MCATKPRYPLEVAGLYANASGRPSSLGSAGAASSAAWSRGSSASSATTISSSTWSRSSVASSAATISSSALVTSRQS